MRSPLTLLLIGSCLGSSLLLSGCTANSNPSTPNQAMTTPAPTTASATTTQLTAAAALLLAQKSECTTVGSVSEAHTFNTNSQTWWFEITDANKPGCSPACVVDDQTSAVSINWRCTGAKLIELTPADSEKSAQ